MSIGYTNLQISRIQDKNTLWRGFRCRFRLADLLISCERKAYSCKKICGLKNIRVLLNGAVLTWKLYWCVLIERNSCLWLPPGDMAVRVLLERVTFLGHWSCITAGPLPAYQSRSYRGGREAAAPRNCWAGQIKSVDGFVLFRLSYFDCSDLHLCSILMGEDTDSHPALLGLKKTCNVPVPWRLESHKL